MMRIIYLLGIFTSILLFSTELLDYTLVPRFICLAVSVTVIIGMISLKPGFNYIKPGLILSSYLIYIFIKILSVSWAINKAEALFDISRSILGFSVFALTLYFFKLNADSKKIGAVEKFVKNKKLIPSSKQNADKINESFLNDVIKLFVIIALILSCVGIYQIMQFEVSKENTYIFYKVTGLNSHKNLFASFLFLLTPFCIIGSLRLFKIWKGLSIISLLCSLFYMIILQTRAVWLGLTFTLLLLTIIHALKSKIQFKTIFKSKIMLYVIGFVCISVAFVFYKGSFSQLSERLNVFNYLHTDKERLILWLKSISLIKSHMFFGVGAGNWQIVYPNSSIVGLDRVEFSNITFQRPHNDFLWIISESGLTGFFFYIIVLFALIFCSIKYILSKNNYSYKMQILILTCFLSGYLVISFFDFPRERIEHIILFNTIIGIIYSMLDNEFKFKSLTIFKIKKIYFGLLIMPIFILITYIGAKRYHGESNSKQLYYYMDKGQTNNALNSFEAAYSIFFTIDPTSIPLHWYRGTLNFQMEKYSEALSDFQKAYTYNPYNKNVLNDLASSYEKNGNHNKAKELYNESLRISPNFNDPKLNLSAIYFKEGNYIKALDVIKTVSDGDDRKKHFYDIIVSHLHK